MHININNNNETIKITQFILSLQPSIAPRRNGRGLVKCAMTAKISATLN